MSLVDNTSFDDIITIQTISIYNINNIDIISDWLLNIVKCRAIEKVIKLRTCTFITVLSLYLFTSKSLNRVSRLSDPNKRYYVQKQPTARVWFPYWPTAQFQNDYC